MEKSKIGDGMKIKGFNMSFEDIDSFIQHKKKVRRAHEKEVSLDYPELRKWDMNLLSYFKPFYTPLCDMCCLCTYGRCDLSTNKKGSCGINLEKQQARTILMMSCIGASAHAAHARDLVDMLMEEDPEGNSDMTVQLIWFHP